jgi:hypothetical protein
LKKLLVLLLALACTLGMAVPAASAESSYQPINMELNGVGLNMEAYSVGGRTMVPLRAIFERLQAEIVWNDAERSVTAVKDSTTLYLVIDNPEAKVNGEAVLLDVPPLIINESTFVPVRFVSESLGADVEWDAATQTVNIVTDGTKCAGGQVHEGTINPAGETWTRCGSPHFVRGDFFVEGLNNPVLTIEAGATVRFEKDASLIIGDEQPGGLLIQGTADQPVVLTADTSGPVEGFWKGIRFGEATIRDKARIEGAHIEYAGGLTGAIFMVSGGPLLQVTVKDTEIRNSLYSGIEMVHNSRLSDESGNITISGTKIDNYGIGFPMITDLTGSHLIPEGNYTGNDIDAIRITSINTYATLARSTTWRDAGVPYYLDITLAVEGPGNPLLTIEPGVTTLWAPYTFLEIANNGKGGLKAVGTAEKPITFAGSVDKLTGWSGILIGSAAVSSGIDLQHVIISNAENGITMYEDYGGIIKNSQFTKNKRAIFMPLYEEGQTDYRKGLGNTFEGNSEDQNIEE